jgi:hypothetical protein
MMVGLGPMDATSSYSRLILFDIAGTTFISTIFMIFHAMSVSGSRVPDQTDQSGQRVDCNTISTSSFVTPMCQPAIWEVSRALTHADEMS